MRLKQLIGNGKEVLAIGGLLLACHAAVYAGGHCRSCCNPCPTLTGDFFGYYPTQWRPWPVPSVLSTDRPAEPTPARPMPNPPATNEPVPSPLKNKSQDNSKPEDLGFWKHSSPYSSTPVAVRHSR
jgi:hypothetical protein